MTRQAAILSALLLASPLYGQIPATAATAGTQAQPAAVAPAKASITWTGTALTIRANGETLRTILRDVSQLTGMKITGGVPEEPVFGSYGPGSAQEVLPQLFDGISVNMMLVNDGASRPKELVLTTRNGAASPPQTRPIDEAEQGFRRRRPTESFNQPTQVPPPPQQPPQQPAVGLGVGPAPAPATTDGSSTPASTDASGQPQSPNGVKTPEQIFEELRKRQGQQTQQQ